MDSDRCLTYHTGILTGSDWPYRDPYRVWHHTGILTGSDLHYRDSDRFWLIIQGILRGPWLTIHGILTWSDWPYMGFGPGLTDYTWDSDLVWLTIQGILTWSVTIQGILTDHTDLDVLSWVTTLWHKCGTNVALIMGEMYVFVLEIGEKCHGVRFWQWNE